MLDNIDVLRHFREELLEKVGAKTGWGKEELGVLIIQVHVEVLEQALRETGDYDPK